MTQRKLKTKLKRNTRKVVDRDTGRVGARGRELATTLHHVDKMGRRPRRPHRAAGLRGCRRVGKREVAEVGEREEEAAVLDVLDDPFRIRETKQRGVRETNSAALAVGEILHDRGAGGGRGRGDRQCYGVARVDDHR